MSKGKLKLDEVIAELHDRVYRPSIGSLKLSDTEPDPDTPSMDELFENIMSSCIERMKGKGNSRHSNYDLPIDQQVWYIKGKTFDYGCLFQASKKLDEAVGMNKRGDTPKAIDELLDAINYIIYQIVLMEDNSMN